MACKLGGLAGKKAFDAAAHIAGGCTVSESFFFGKQLLVQRAIKRLAHQAAHMPISPGWTFGEALHQFGNFSLQVGSRHYAVDQAHLQSFICAQRVA